MTFDNHQQTIDKLKRETNNTIAGLLPGYIERHREEILEAVIDEARKRDPHESQGLGSINWGAEQALDILAEGLVGEEL